MKRNEFITSDTHFGHKNIIRHVNRPFTDVKEMDEALIEAWNRKVPENATVYHLGDFAFVSPRYVSYYIRRLNGNIRFIYGNHDRGIDRFTAGRFDWARDYYESRTETDRKVVMCHYPIASWNRMHHGSWMLHGHCHGTYEGVGRIMDVGVDCHPNFEPFSFDEVEQYMDTRQFEPVDHHLPPGNLR